MPNLDEEELYLYIKNDGDLYRTQRGPIQKALAKKYTDGSYLHVRAVDAFKRICDVGAKKYAAEFGGEYKCLPSVRRDCAERFAFELEAELAISTHRAPPRKKTPAQLDRDIATVLKKR